jgi:hypothetical protein
MNDEYLVTVRDWDFKTKINFALYIYKTLNLGTRSMHNQQKYKVLNTMKFHIVL